MKPAKTQNKKRKTLLTKNAEGAELKLHKFHRISLVGELEGLSEDDRFNRYRKMWEQANAYKLLTNFPMHLDIELSGLCNLSCEHCFQNKLISGKLGFMDWGLYKKIIDEGVAKGLCAIKLQVRGESMLHPKFFDAVNYAKHSGIMDVQLTTNATLLNKETINATLDSGLDGIIFSVDHQHGKSFQNQYTKGQYSAIEEIIRQFLIQRRKRGIAKPWVRLQTAVPELNNTIRNETQRQMKERFPEADIFSVNRIQDFREDVDAYPDLHTNYDIGPCSYLMHRLTIFWNGEVTLCCVDYNNRFKLGSVKDDSIQNIWLSEKAMNYRIVHYTGNRHHMNICRHCHLCATPKNIQSENIH